MSSWAAKATGLSGLAALVIFLAACGGGNDGGGRQDSTAVTALASNPLDLVLPDCSPSFRRASKELIPEMVAVALNSAMQRRWLWAACFAGAPLRHLAWKSKVDFDELPGPLADNPALADRFNAARALGLRRKLKRMIRRTPRKAPGSGQLEALELASQTPGVGRVFMFTDGLLLEPDGVVLRTASRREIEEAVDLWAPRLRGLKDVEIYLVGVGLGSLSSKSVRKAHELFRRLAQSIGASLSWTRSLPLEY